MQPPARRLSCPFKGASLAWSGQVSQVPARAVGALAWPWVPLDQLSFNPLQGERMNKDQVKGAVKEAAGKVQQKTGEILGSTDQEAKGLARKIEGKVQQKVGDAKEKVEDAKDALKDAKDKI